MCWLSVQCCCKHNIAIPHPAKACIRPRNPRGCWIIRRGDPLKTPCPGCEEYHIPGAEQPSWKDVKRCHDDPVVEWSEINHSDIISMDRARHKSCENDRLDFKRRLRWKAMIADGRIEGWSLTDTGAMVNNVVDDDDGEDFREHEVMEPVDQNEIDKMLLDSDEKEEDEEGLIGYKLQRVSAATQLAAIPDGNDAQYSEQDFNMIFQVSENSDSSGSDGSNEAVNGEDDSETVTTGYQPDKDGENESLMKLDEMFREVEAAKPFNPSSGTFPGDVGIWAPTPSESPTGDPVKKQLFHDIPIKLELKKQPDTAVAPVTATPETSVASTTSGAGEPVSRHREKIDKALRQMRRMQAAYFDIVTPELPERPTTPTPMSVRDGDSDEESESKTSQPDPMIITID
ncbi:hypothetical protein TWF281_006750 [Arthrobotrys megalospora]